MSAKTQLEDNAGLSEHSDQFQNGSREVVIHPPLYFSLGVDTVLQPPQVTCIWV